MSITFRFLCLYTIMFFLQMGNNHLHAQKVSKKPLPAKKTVQWLSVNEAEERMKTEPRKVLVDTYTDWCGWCKVMDQKTFSDPKVIDYLNTYFYCIKLNAERKDTITFAGKQYGLYPNSKVNALAAEWMKHKLTYPTCVFMEEGFKNPQPVPGYLEVANLEMILKYYGENKFKQISWEKHRNDFKSEWTGGASK